MGCKDWRDHELAAGDVVVGYDDTCLLGTGKVHLRPADAAEKVKSVSL